MLSSFPKLISNKAIGTYIACLALISIVFMNYAMPFKFMLMGLVFVLLFFGLSPALSRSWKTVPPKVFVRNVFLLALFIRIIWVVFSYYFYTKNTGKPFEFGAADAMGYHDTAKWMSEIDWSRVFHYLLVPGGGVSDIGYVVYLTFLYKIFGPSILVARFMKAILSAWMCILVYKLSSRTFGDSVGRIAALFCTLMPNLIAYCGLHLKETEMVFCAVMFLERTDYVIRTKRYSVINIVIPILFAFSLFFFRTVLGVIAVFSFFTALLFNPDRVIKKGKRLILAVWMIVAVVVLAGGTIMTEVEEYWNLRVTNETAKRQTQSETAKWAKYATGTVMAPMIFTLPFATMVDTEQYNQNVMHGGNYVKNFLGIFIVFAFLYAFKQKKWRDFSLIGVFTIGYLGVISFSGYANAERFHMPTLPCLLMMAAYGVSQLNNKNLKFVNFWCFVIVLMEFGWAFFKLGSRDLASF